MNDQIMVSICCTAYNHEKYIRRALDGFVSQVTDFKYEVIVNDDASYYYIVTVYRMNSPERRILNGDTFY